MKRSNRPVTVIATIAVIFIAIVALYGVTTLLGGHQPAGAPGSTADEATAASPDDNALATAPPTQPITAFTALTVATDNPTVQQWMANRKVIAVTSISADFCTDGLSDRWTIVYASEGGQLAVCVDRGVVASTVTSTSISTLGIDTRSTIDSDKAWAAVADTIGQNGMHQPEVAAMMLKTIDGKLSWDFSYDNSGILTVMRVDARTGSVEKSVIVGQE